LIKKKTPNKTGVYKFAVKNEKHQENEVSRIENYKPLYNQVKSNPNMNGKNNESLLRKNSPLAFKDQVEE